MENWWWERPIPEWRTQGRRQRRSASQGRRSPDAKSAPSNVESQPPSRRQRWRWLHSLILVLVLIFALGLIDDDFGLVLEPQAAGDDYLLAFLHPAQNLHAVALTDSHRDHTLASR